MRLNMSAWAIRKPIPSVVLFIVLMNLGAFSFKGLPITRFPNIDIPIVAITVTQAGAAPSELQNQVTKRVEDAVAGTNGVKHIISAVSEGLSTTTIQFHLEVNTDRAVNDVKDAIAKIRADLPRTIDEPIVQRIDLEGLRSGEEVVARAGSFLRDGDTVRPVPAEKPKTAGNDRVR